MKKDFVSWKVFWLFHYVFGSFVIWKFNLEYRLSDTVEYVYFCKIKCFINTTHY